jgi:hypothetical protein
LEETLADSIIDKAIGLMPGLGKPKRAKKATTQTQLATLKRNLAKLAQDVEKLGRLIGSSQKRSAAKQASGRPKRARANG